MTHLTHVKLLHLEHYLPTQFCAFIEDLLLPDPEQNARCQEMPVSYDHISQVL